MRSPIAIIELGSYERSDDGVGLNVAERLIGIKECRMGRGQDDAMGIQNTRQGSKLAVVVDAVAAVVDDRIQSDIDRFQSTASDVESSSYSPQEES